ncbi:MAG: alpha/beta hydrolase [Bacteroidia bacterium]
MKRLIVLAAVILLYIPCNGQKDGFVNSADNSKIYYRTYGKGKPMLIINGGPGMNSDGFVSLAMQLSGKYQTIIFDQRGTGKSTVDKPDSTNITMALMAEDMELLRKHLNISTWIILGHSFGGMLASYYATIYPDKIDALILSSSGGIDMDILNMAGNSINSKLSKMELDSVNYWNDKINNGDTSYSAKLQRGTFLAAAYVYDRKNIPVIAKRLTQSNALVGGLVWDDMTRINFDCSLKLSSFDKPVLIIQGKEDIVNEGMALKAHKAFKNSKLVYMDRCVHYGWLDRPDLYFAEIDKFLQSK